MSAIVCKTQNWIRKKIEKRKTDEIETQWSGKNIVGEIIEEFMKYESAHALIYLLLIVRSNMSNHPLDGFVAILIETLNSKKKMLTQKRRKCG